MCKLKIIEGKTRKELGQKISSFLASQLHFVLISQETHFNLKDEMYMTMIFYSIKN